MEAALKKLDRYEVVILDDIGYVQQSREEMEVLFTFLAERYERRSLIINSNLVFSNGTKSEDQMTTMAAIDRLVHHATILDFCGDSHRVKTAKAKSEKMTPTPTMRTFFQALRSALAAAPGGASGPGSTAH